MGRRRHCGAVTLFLDDHEQDADYGGWLNTHSVYSSCRGDLWIGIELQFGAGPNLLDRSSARMSLRRWQSVRKSNSQATYDPHPLWREPETFAPPEALKSSPCLRKR